MEEDQEEDFSSLLKRQIGKSDLNAPNLFF